MREVSIKRLDRTFLPKPTETTERIELGIQIRSLGFSIRISLEAVSSVEKRRNHRKRVGSVSGFTRFFNGNTNSSMWVSSMWVSSM